MTRQKTIKVTLLPPSELEAIRQEALDFAGIGLYRYRFDGTVLFMDRGAFRIMDLASKFPDPTSVIGRNIAELFVYTGPKGLLRSQIKKHRRLRGFEYRFKTITGIDKVVVHDSYLVKDPKTGRDVIQVIMFDVTERKQTEEQLRHVLKGARCILWHALVRESEDHALTWDIRVFNEEAAEQLLPLKRRRGESYSEAWNARVPPEDRLRMDQTSTRALRTGKPGYSQEYRCEREDGELRWLFEDTRIQKMGPSNWLLIGVCTDVTDRKRAEHALRVSEERYRAVVDSQTDLVVRFKPDTTITFVNEAVCRLVGKKPPQLIGQSFLPFIPAASRERLKSSYAALTRDLPTTTNENPIDVPGLGPRWFQWTNRALFDDQGRVVEIQGVGRDITERRRIDAQQQATAAGLRAVVAIADQLISCPDEDTAYRKAVELARSHLGTERCAIFVRRGGLLQGTYGTDRDGHTTDEHAHQFPTSQDWLERLQALGPQDRRMIVVEQAHVEWKENIESQIGKGWIAITPIQSATEFLGVFCNDTAITGAPMDDTRQEIVSVFCSLLGAIIERKRAEVRPRVLSTGLKTVLSVADELIACPDLDSTYRRAVELAREKLGVERCAIFLREGSVFRGTYGTNLQAQTTDEHAHVFPAYAEWLEHFHEFRPADRQMVIHEEPYTEWKEGVATRFEKGWVAVTPIQTADRLLAVFSNDTAISRAPADETQQEIISVFCSLLGAVVQRKQAVDELRRLTLAVVVAADELMSAPDLDAFYRRAVELARERLGVERCAIFIREGDVLKGTYGTNRRGETTAEHDHVFRTQEGWLKRIRSLTPDDTRLTFMEQPHVEWIDGQEVSFGKGWIAVTPIQSATEVMGVFCNDAALTGAPVDPTKQEIVTLYCSLLGALIARKRTDEALVESERRFREILENALLIALTLDLEGNITYCNEFLLNLTGWTREETIGRNWFTMFVPEEVRLALWPMYLKQAPKGLVPVHHENDLVTRAGEHRTIWWNNTALRDTAGHIIGVTSLGEDVTERKEAEAQIRRLALVVEQEAEAVIIAATDGSIQYVNPAFERMAGYSREEVAGKNPRILKSGRQDAEFYRRMWETLSGGGVWSGHFTNRNKEGALYEVEAVISPIRDNDGRIVSYVSTCRDITREVQLEQQFQQSQKMEAIGRLAGGIAHDFNNLLTSILGYSRLIADELGDGHALRGDLDEIIRAGERAASLTKQLLAFSRKQMIQPHALNVNAVVMDMDKLLRRTLGEDIELLTLVDHEMCGINADAGLIEQIIMNLSINARDAMPKGGALTIQTSNVVLDEEACRGRIGLRPGKHVLISIRDTGVGMTEEVREHCFEPFFTTKEAGKGTGLGLSIVYSTVKQFGGAIEVQSAPNTGTNVLIYFPSVEGGAAPSSQREEATLPRGTETILVVEDEDTVRRLTVRILESLGYHVLEARHGGEALLICERHKEPLHMVLTDVVMPHIGGQDLVERLRQIRKDFKVLYMSGFTDQSFVHGGQGVRSAPLLIKPFTQELLAVKIRRILDSPAPAE